MKIKFSFFALFVVFVLLVIQLPAQTNYTILLKNGNLQLPLNGAEFVNQFDINNEQVYNSVYYKLVQFHAIPSTKQQEKMRALGFDLLEYIPHNAWVVSINATLDVNKLKRFNIRSVINLDNNYKLHPDLFNKNYPAHALRGSDKIELVAVRHSNTKTAEVVSLLKQNNFELLEYYPESRNIRLIVNTKQIDILSALPYLTYLEVVAPPAEPEDTRGRSLHRANGISTSPFYGAGRKYDGTGVKVAVNDDGDVGPHIDYTGRIDNSTGSYGGTHGDGVAGIVGAAGNLDPSNAGMATGVFQKIRQYNSSLPGTVTLHTTEQIMMYNSSYSNGVNAGYTSTTQLVDNEIYNNPSLIQIFSAGNSNGSGSTPAGSQWFNITGGHKAAKNVMATANLYYDDVLVSSSSRGPAHDGRIKPDIASNGQNQISTDPNNTYGAFGGTSGAAPGIMGCAAQLYHAYKELNGGTNPASALIKAALINTAYDLGNAGPDFKYGWGRINALRALRLIEDNRYLSSTISNGGNNTHNITVPSNVGQMRVMVYWADPSGSVGTNKALVNDIDITLTDPATNNHLPLILDPTPNATTLDLPAVPGVDTLNNVEQVRIENPVAGSYTLNVGGTTIPTGPQTYWVVYEFILNEIEVTYPIGGESFVPGETEALRWDAHGTSGNFTIEYSTDNGSTWNTITTSVSGSARFYNWNIPGSLLTGDALIRVSRGAYSDTSEDNFSIIGVPTGLAVDFACPDSVRLIWNAVSGATSYEVSQLGTMYMDSVGTSTTTSHIVSGLNPVDEFWFSVRAQAAGIEGRRAVAIIKNPGTFSCPIAIDGSVLSFISPGASTLLDCHNNNSVPITITVENKGLNPISNFDVSYRVNGGTIFTETIAGPLASLTQLNHTFAGTVNLSVAGSYLIESWISVTSDGNAFNDSISINVTVIASGIQTLPFLEDFESFSACGTASNCELTICSLNNGFINLGNGEDDDIDWRTDAGGTPSSGTGPGVDHNPGTSTGKYLYTEVSGSPVCASKTAMMMSPCIDLNGTLTPELRFWYHMEGTSMGSLHVDVFSGGTWTNDVMTPISGTQGANWLMAVVDLSSYVNQIINFRIRGVTGSSWSSDIAIDDISVLESAAPPAVAFSADETETCINKTVQFTDNSLNNPTSWAWSFTPNTVTYVNGTNSNSQNPEVEFNALGSYDVTLVATNTYGNNSLTQSSYINVNAAVSLTVTEDFQSSFPPASWSLVASPSGLDWISASVIGSSGTQTDVAYVNNYVNNFPGEESAMITMPIDLSGTEIPAVLFDVAYAPYSATLFEGLRIDVSTDCGETFTPSSYFKENLDLATVPPQTSSWAPGSAADWRRDTAELAAFAGMDANISFININNYGNGLYIDNIMVEDLCSGYTLSTVQITNNTCFGTSLGSVDIDIAAGTSPYTYTWSNGASTQDLTNIGSGTYELTVTDVNGCERNGTYVVTEGIEIIATTSKQNVNCNGAGDGSASVVAGGGIPPFSYLWNTVPAQTTTTISNLGPAFYTVTITDNIGCTKTSVVEVREPDELLGFFVPTSPTSPNFNNGEINLLVTGGIAPYTYIWSNGETTEDISNLTAGTYFCTVVDRRGCAILITATLSNQLIVNNHQQRDGDEVFEVYTLNDVIIYPNPSKGKITFEFEVADKQHYNVKLFDLKGALIMSKSKRAIKGFNQMKFDLSKYPPGEYVIRLSNSSAVLVRKVLIEK